jgi:phage terminase small subunit
VVIVAKKSSKAGIKADLLDQMERDGTVGKYYLDLVDDYMEMYDTKKKLIKDIKDRGVSVEYNNGGGQKGFKKNDSVDQLLKVNQQMLKMLVALGIKPSQDGDSDADEEM